MIVRIVGLMKNVNIKINYSGTKRITWNSFEKYIRQLAELIKSSGVDIKDIYGISRGGFIPAVRLSHLLNIPMVNFYGIADYGKYTLVVDDISDTGKTLENIKKINYPFIMTATLIFNTTSLVEPDFYVIQQGLSKDWVEFPWEAK